MPWATKDMIEAVNASTPNSEGSITKLHYTLGPDFDKFMDMKYVFEPMPDEMIAEFNKMHEELKPQILEQLIAAHQEIEEKRASGTLDFSFGDSQRAINTGKEKTSVRDLADSYT